jgi:hypothetical protein
VPLGKGIEFQPVDLVKATVGPTKLVVRNILEDRRNSLWIVTDTGLFRRFPDGQIEHFYNPKWFCKQQADGAGGRSAGRSW